MYIRWIEIYNILFLKWKLYGLYLLYMFPDCLKIRWIMFTNNYDVLCIFKFLFRKYYTIYDPMYNKHMINLNMNNF